MLAGAFLFGGVMTQRVMAPMGVRTNSWTFRVPKGAGDVFKRTTRKSNITSFSGSSWKKEDARHWTELELNALGTKHPRRYFFAWYWTSEILGGGGAENLSGVQTFCKGVQGGAFFKGQSLDCIRSYVPKNNRTYVLIQWKLLNWRLRRSKIPQNQGISGIRRFYVRMIFYAQIGSEYRE